MEVKCKYCGKKIPLNELNKKGWIIYSRLSKEILSGLCPECESILRNRRKF